MVLCPLVCVPVIQERFECGEEWFVEFLLCVKIECLFVEFSYDSCWCVSVSLKRDSFVGGDKMRKKKVGDGYYVVESKGILN